MDNKSRYNIVVSFICIVLFCLILRLRKIHEHETSVFVKEIEKLSSELENAQSQKRTCHSKLTKCEDLRIKYTYGYEACQKQVFEPSLKYEVIRKRIRKTLNYMWDTLDFRINDILAKCQNETTHLETLMHSIYEHKILLLSDFNQMTEYDGYNDWRLKEKENLDSIFQERFNKMQFSKDCGKTKHLNCVENFVNCDWACKMEKVLNCYAQSYQMGRALVINEEPDTKFVSDHLKKYYRPTMGQCKTSIENEAEFLWDGNNIWPVIRMNSLKSYKTPSKFLLPAIPTQFVRRLEKLFSDPRIWWINVIIKNFFKYTEQTLQSLNKYMNEIGVEYPTVGVHIENNQIPLKEYMIQVKEFYDTLELSEEVKKRRVYISTNDTTIIEEAIANYPDYNFLVKPKADDSDTIPTPIKEVFILSHCNFLVGTFNSKFFLLSVAFFQNYNIDAMFHVKSIHTQYYSEDMQCKIIANHSTTYDGDISANIGEIFSLSNQWNAYGVIKIQSSDGLKSGFIPAFKCANLALAVDGHRYET